MGSAMFKVSQYSQLWGEGAESLKGSQTREVTKHGEIVWNLNCKVDSNNWFQVAY